MRVEEARRSWERASKILVTACKRSLGAHWSGRMLNCGAKRKGSKSKSLGPEQRRTGGKRPKRKRKLERGSGKVVILDRAPKARRWNKGTRGCGMAAPPDDEGSGSSEGPSGNPHDKNPFG